MKFVGPKQIVLGLIPFTVPKILLLPYLSNLDYFWEIWGQNLIFGMKVNLWMGN